MTETHISVFLNYKKWKKCLTDSFIFVHQGLEVFCVYFNTMEGIVILFVVLVALNMNEQFSLELFSIEEIIPMKSVDSMF